MVLVEASDLVRQDFYRGFATAEERAKLFRQSLQRTDELVGRAARRGGPAPRHRAGGRPQPPACRRPADRGRAPRAWWRAGAAAFRRHPTVGVCTAGRRRAHDPRPPRHRPAGVDGGGAGRGRGRRRVGARPPHVPRRSGCGGALPRRPCRTRHHRVRHRPTRARARPARVRAAAPGLVATGAGLCGSGRSPAWGTSRRCSWRGCSRSTTWARRRTSRSCSRSPAALGLVYEACGRRHPADAIITGLAVIIAVLVLDVVCRRPAPVQQRARILPEGRGALHRLREPRVRRARRRRRCCWPGCWPIASGDGGACGARSRCWSACSWSTPRPFWGSDVGGILSLLPAFAIDRRSSC